jgi:hypothetical protein
MVYSLAAVEKTASHLNFLFCYCLFESSAAKNQSGA